MSLRWWSFHGTDRKLRCLFSKVISLCSLKAKQRGNLVICFYMWAQLRFIMSSAVFSWGRVWGYFMLLNLTVHCQDLLAKSGEVSLDISAAAQVITCLLLEGFWGTWGSFFCQTSLAQWALELPLCSSVFLANTSTPSVSHSRSAVSLLSISFTAISVHSHRDAHTLAHLIHLPQSSPLILSRLVCITSSPRTGRAQTRFTVPWKCCFPQAEMGKYSRWERWVMIEHRSCLVSSWRPVCFILVKLG